MLSEQAVPDQPFKTSVRRDKFHCALCDVVVKAQHGAMCPSCGGYMTPMGPRWRPGRRGSRARMWDFRQSRETAVYWSAAEGWFVRRPVVPRRVGRKRARAIREGLVSPVQEYRV